VLLRENSNRGQHIVRRQRYHSNGQTLDKTNFRADRRRFLAESLRQAAIRSRNRTLEDRDEELLSTNDLDLLPEEAAYLMARKRAIEPYLLKQSPILLQEMIDEQQQNPGWRMRIENYMGKLLTEEKFAGTALVEVDCRTSLCKMELQHKTVSDFELFRDQAATEGPLDTDQHGKPEFLEDGSVMSTMYFAREGGDPEPFEEMHERLYSMVLDHKLVPDSSSAEKNVASQF